MANKSNYGYLNQFKSEVANELGISNYDNIDKGQLSSRQNGYVGGTMTKKMVAFAENAMQSGNVSNVNVPLSNIHSGSNKNS